MSGCCGQGPVIVSGAAATPRVDVETLLLCDVRADGTVAGLVLVEPVYDTTSGARVGTRLVEPATGNPYTPVGTMGLCSPPDDACARQISQVTRCDDTTGDGVGDTEYVEVWALDPCDGGAPLLVGTYLAGDFSSPYTPTSPAPCPQPATPDSPVVLGTVCYSKGTGGTSQAAVLKCQACTDPTVTYLDLATGAVLTAPTIVPCEAAPDRSTLLLCDVAADGTATAFLRTLTTDEAGTAATDTLLDGTTAYTPTGTVGVCFPPSDCASPTTPTATVGLCLPDGTPIAVTVVRNCAGVVTSEGWLNLRTGAFSAGAPPAGTVACGDSQSVQVSGTFCDVDPDGNVVGLVLIEYSYAADGTIASVRLVDATTGATYTPTGTITTCPVGVEQPEQDVVQLCDTAADGTVTPFIRDYRRDELGTVTGHSDYTLAGAAYTPTGTVGTCQPAPQPERDLVQLCDVQADGTSVQFVRDYQRDPAGTVTGHADYTLDGTTPYTPTGTVGTCTPAPCRTCETLLLCDEVGNDPATIRPRGVSSGTLSNGVTWSARGSAPLPSTYDNADGAWWGIATFPNPVYPNSTWTFSRPATVEFSVYIRYNASGTGSDNTAQLPAGLEVVSLPRGYSYNPVTGILTATGDTLNDPCTYLTDPHVATSARFRTPNPVTSVSAQYLGARIAVCGVFGNYRIGAFTVTPPGQFLRTVCRDCQGAVSSVRDTELDGTTAYTPLGAVGVCQPPADPEPEQCCQPVQVCIAQDPTQSVEFISNEAHRNDNTVDPVWKWTTDLTAANPPWYDMYQRQYSTAWSVVDSDTARPAWWVSPHPNGNAAQSSPPLTNEGPSLLNTHWYPRAYFDLPDNADPTTIRVQATVFNADQAGRAFRLNNGAWQTLPATATHNGTTYTFGPATIPGAQAGRNYLYLDVEETVGGGAGLMVHLKVTYDVIPEVRSWTRMVCCDNSVYYLDEKGQRQDAIPGGWHLAPCGGGSASTTDCTKQVVERCGCDDTTGDGLGDVTYTELWAVDPCNGAAPELLGTYRDGDLTQPYTPTKPVECTAADQPPGPLSTGVRNVTGTAVQNVAGAFPGVQSVSLTVLAGTVNVTMSDGANVAIPAGVTMTWSVAKDEDSKLAAASFAGATTAANYLLNWTYR